MNDRRPDPESPGAERTTSISHRPRTEIEDGASEAASAPEPASGPFVRLDPARYSVESQIGEGGMGTVYRVVDRTLGRTVAMKVCKRGPGEGDTAAGEPTAHARFLEEAHVTAQLDHPGIVPVHELGVDEDQQTYFTMSLVKGKTLSDVFDLVKRKEEGWNLSRAAGVMIKVCQAVAYAHSKGIIHRDLKPANVMVGRFGEVYVLDWGLAKSLDGEDPHDLRLTQEPRPDAPDAGDTARISSESPLVTQDGTVLGTPIYMAPEQAEGRVDEIDELSDVYSLGAMLYELLTAQLPYLPPGARVAPWVVLARLVEGPPRPVLEVAPSAPRELAAICQKAMARDRAERYESAFQLAEDLQAYLDHRVVGAYRTGRLTELKLWCYRHRRTLSAGAVVGLLCALALFTYNWVAKTRQAERLIASGEQHIDQYRTLKSDLFRLRTEWEVARRNHEKQDPVWERGDELATYRRLAAARQRMDAHFNGAELDLANALRIAPGSGPRSRAQAKLEELYLDRYRNVTGGETVLVSPLYYRNRLQDLDPRKYPAELEKPGLVRLRSDPPGADVYCFRYETNEEERLVPRPFDPARGEVLGEPFLRVARILKSAEAQRIFEVGDRLVEVNGRPVKSRGELASALEGLGRDDRVRATIERHGQPLEVEWAPFAASVGLPPGSLKVIHYQLGIIFEGYPLDFVGGARAGRTASDGPLEIELPRGSYLLVLRRQGCRDTRFPVVVPWRERIETVRLLRDGEFPLGPGEFVHVLAGPATHGGDALAFQSLDLGEAEVGDFLIGRFEVTIAEYLDFLNDPAMKIDDKGGLPAPAPGEEGIQVVPHDSENKRYYERDDQGRWSAPTTGDLAAKMLPTAPVFAVSQLAAIEYARWRSSKDPRWTYRLPTDLEWEKAARGVDRRAHVWGEYLVWAFCWSSNWWKGGGTFPTFAGAFSFDESVYGVRDLGGSMAELTSSRIDARDPYVSRRGGNWRVSDEENLRIATRNGILPDGRSTEIGFRLVAVPAAKW